MLASTGWGPCRESQYCPKTHQTEAGPVSTSPHQAESTKVCKQTQNFSGSTSQSWEPRAKQRMLGRPETGRLTPLCAQGTVTSALSSVPSLRVKPGTSCSYKIKWGRKRARGITQ